MRIACLPVTSMQENVYFYYDSNTKAGIVIDPGGEPDRLCRFIADNELRIEGILLTHGHFDHILAVGAVKEATSAPVACHADESVMLSSMEQNFSSIVRRNTELKADILFNDGDVFEFEGHKIKVLHTPGHTRGGVSY